MYTIELAISTHLYENHFYLFIYAVLMKGFSVFVLRTLGLGLIFSKRLYDRKEIQSVKSSWSILNSELTLYPLYRGLIKNIT